jgi:hypothetical protein
MVDSHQPRDASGKEVDIFLASGHCLSRLHETSDASADDTATNHSAAFVHRDVPPNPIFLDVPRNAIQATREQAHANLTDSWKTPFMCIFRLSQMTTARLPSATRLCGRSFVSITKSVWVFLMRSETCHCPEHGPTKIKALTTSKPLFAWSTRCG